MSSGIRRLLAGVLALGLASPAGAQQQAFGTITGRVLDRATQRPVGSAQVRVVGTQRGAQTDENGVYRITSVPVGPAQLVAQRIGYAPSPRAVTVVANSTITVDFAVAVSATQLDQVLVTATGETQRKRENGNAVATIAPTPEALAATSNFSDVLAARAPGVSVITSGGTTGGGARVRIRGSNSISLSNDPLLIIDGIRVDNGSQSSSIGVGGQLPSRFNDINPEEIENIEIVKGPAAAALYGTAASNGVIQITTKKGRAGKTRWDVFGETGRLHDVNTYPANYLAFGKRVSNGAFTTNCNIDLRARGICTVDSIVTNSPLANSNPIRDGDRRAIGINTAGGSEAATYFLSAEYEKEQGVYDVNHSQKLNLRSNIRGQLTKSLDATVSVGYVNSDLRLPQNDNNLLGALSGGLLGTAFDCGPKNSYPTLCNGDTTSRGFAAGQVPQDIFAINTRQQVQRFIGSLTSNFTPLNWLTFTGTAGADVNNRFDNETIPPATIFASQSLFDGSRQANRASISDYTLNLNGTATYEATPVLKFATSLGGQFTDEIFRRIDAFGAKLLGGTESLNGTNARFAIGEINNDVRTLGYYGREQLSWRDKVFVTAAARSDKNSAFGQNFGNVVYPSLSASWVVGEEDFFRNHFSANTVSSFRLRGAYGKAGQRPGFRQADFFFNPVAVVVAGVDVPGFTVGGPGNVLLQPEVSTELEGGADLGLFNDRLSFEFTAFDKRTKDALVQVPLAPSLGAGNSRFTNLGQVRNRGTELQVRANVLNTDALKFDVTANGSFTANRLDDLGADPLGNPIPNIFLGFSSTQVIRNFYPLGAYFAKPIKSFQDLNGDGIISRVNCPTYGTATQPGTANPQVVGGPACELVLGDTAEFIGTPFPTTEITVNPSITLMDRLRLSALFDHRGGQKLINFTRSFRCSNGGFQNCLDAADPTKTSLEDQAKLVAALAGTQAGYIEDASFTKLRELSATLTLPADVASRIRASAASFTLAGRNLKTWTNYTGFDPEVNALANSNFATADFLTQPNVRYVTARLNLTF